MGFAVAGFVVLIGIICVAVVLLLDRAMDVIVGGSYRLVQSAAARRGQPFYAAVMALAIAVAAVLTIVGIWVSAH